MLLSRICQAAVGTYDPKVDHQTLVPHDDTFVLCVLQQLAEKIVREVKPDVVMLELDADRVEDLPPGSAQKVRVR